MSQQKPEGGWRSNLNKLGERQILQLQRNAECRRLLDFERKIKVLELGQNNSSPEQILLCFEILIFDPHLIRFDFGF